jgi:hypothetical protein
MGSAASAVGSVVSSFSPIAAAADVTKSFIEGDNEQYKAKMAVLDSQNKEETAQVVALFSLIEKTNSGTIDAIKDLNKNIVEITKIVVDSNEKVLVEYQETLRSLGNNIAEQSKNFGQIVLAAKDYDQATKEIIISTAKDVVLDVKNTLSKCFDKIGGLAEKHDQRFSELTKLAIANLAITERTLNKLLENEATFTKATIEVLKNFDKLTI